MTVRTFIGSGGSRLEADIREILAREIHKEYRRTKQDSLKTSDPAMVDWEKLPSVFKKSSACRRNIYLENFVRLVAQRKK